MQHGKVSQQMFPEYEIHSITNGVHAATWLSPEMQKLLDQNIPNWREDNRFFRSVTGIEPAQIAEAHLGAKHRLFEAVASRTGISLRSDVLTLGFARRVATYKRANLLFHDPERLANIARAAGGLQILYAGKAHPADEGGKQLIRNVVEMAHRLSNGTLQILFLENYDWELGKLLTNGVDVWVNTPKRPYEASGTSGMKAALNGVPSLSILDGWWIEGCVEGGTGWAIDDCEDEAGEADSLYEKLRHAIVPAFQKPAVWNRLMQQTIAINATFFNTHRMAAQYVENAYFPEQTVAQEAEVPVTQLY
jgi:starch phosphorylase